MNNQRAPICILLTMMRLQYLLELGGLVLRSARFAG
jgi:hypothetical protein